MSPLTRHHSRVSRNGLHTFEGAVEARRTPAVACELADVVDASVARRLFDSLLVADEDDLHARAKRAPTLDRVSLDVADVSPKRLGDCEQSQHRGRP